MDELGANTQSPLRVAEPQSNAERNGRSTRALWRWLVWFALTSSFVAFIGVATITTRLGVKVANQFADKRGREHVWRIWWRAQHEVTDFGRQDLFAVLFLGLAVTFVALAVACVWIALVPEERDEHGPTEASAPASS